MIKFVPLFFIVASLCSCKQRNINIAENKKYQDSITYLNRSLDFIKQVLPDEMADTSIVLISNTSPFEYQNRVDWISRDTANFSKEDIQELKAKVPNTIQQWTKVHFPKATLISYDTFKAIFKDSYKGWTYFSLHYGTRLYTISKPIFLKNNTYCLFYHGYTCGILCGSGKISLYKLELNKWIEVRSYWDWES